MNRASGASDPRRRNQPLNEPIGERGQRASRRDPAVVASAHVPGRGSDDVPTVAPDVDAIAELSGRVSDLGTRVGEPSVFTARTGSDLPSAKGTVSRLQIGERITTSVRRVDIDHHKTRLATSPDAHVCCRPLPPPSPDDPLIRRCVRESARDLGMLRRRAALVLAAGAAASGRLVDRKDSPVPPGVPHRHGAVSAQRSTPISVAGSWGSARGGATDA